MINLIKSKSNTEILEFNEKLVKKVAKDWVEISAGVKKNDNVMILYDVGGRQLAKEVAELCSKKGARVWYKVRDLDLDAVLAENLSDRDVERYFQFVNNEIYTADVVFMLRAARSNDVMSKVPENKMKIYSAAQKPVYMNYRVNNTNWQLIYWPTLAEAKEENIPFEDYVNMFFDASDQDWTEIKKAQRILVNLLNKGKTLELYANTEDKDPLKRTFLTLSIDGMEFVNSTIDRNYPGSEVFSAPVKESVNGQLFRKGICPLGHEGKKVEDVFFKIENGKIIEAKAKLGEKELNEMLKRDEGASYFGEIAFGTNPGLRKQVFNGLLNEKVGGSFHITPGNAYDDVFPDVNGKFPHIDNGNKSSIHWDITIMMLPEYGGGEVKLDGKTIQKNGKWLVPGTEALNKGL